MDAPAQFSHKEGLYLGLCNEADVIEENISQFTIESESKKLMKLSNAA